MVVFIMIILASGAQAFCGIVVIQRGASVIPAAWSIKLRTQILCWARHFGAGFHANAAGKAGGDHYRFAAAGDRFKFDYAFIDIHFSEAAAVYLNVKLGSP